MRIPVTSIETPGLSEVQKPEKPEHGFADALQDAVGQVDKLQVESDQQADQLASGGGNLHETALAMEKADVAMRVAVKVRNKLVDAYNEVMHMSV